MANSENDSEMDSHPFQVFARPEYQLRSLPVEMRWEVTRRHPFYQIYWRLIRPSETVTIAEAETCGIIRNVALSAIGCISVSIPPETTFEDIDEDEYPAWMAKSVHPISNRALIGLLLKILPPETLNEVGEIFQTAGLPNQPEGSQKFIALTELSDLKHKILDQYLDELLVSISPMATVRQLQEDLPLVLKHFRNDRDLESQRNRTKDHPKYLEVWDMREGWQEGRYHHDQEKTFQEIADQLDVPISTVSNRYRSAFELITGHRYTPENWFDLFKVLKFSEYSPDLISNIALARPLRSPSPREVPVAVISQSSSDKGRTSFLDQMPASTEEESDLTDERIDFETFLNQGLSDRQIAERMGCDDSKISLIAELRARFGDRPRTSYPDSD